MPVISNSVSLLDAVAVSDVGGSAELVEDLISGLVVPSGDSTTLAAAIERLYHDNDFREYLGRAARRRIEQNFNPDWIVAQALAPYRDLLAEGPNRSS